MGFWNKLSSTVLGIFGKGKKDTDKQEDEKVKTVIEEEVESLSEIDALKQHLTEEFDGLTSMDEYWNALVAIKAVGISCAASDRDFSQSEREEIRKFIDNINDNKDIPADVQAKIDDLYENPLPLNQAYLLAQDTKIEMSVFEELIDVVMHIDGVKFEEKVVLNAWHDFKKSA